MEPSGTKQCPYCAEEIQAEAVICKHCGRDLKPKRKKSHVLLGCLVVIVILIIVGMIGTCGRSLGPPTQQSQESSFSLFPEISTFLQQHPEFGKPVGTSSIPDWARGKRQRVRFDSGRSLLFYIKDGSVVTVFEDRPGEGRIRVWGERETY